jgi:hypothetical protein
MTVAAAALLGSTAFAQVRVVVLQGDAVTGGGGLPAGGLMSAPTINSRGNIAAGVRLASSSTCYLSDVGGVHAIVKNGDAAPGTGNTFADFAVVSPWLDDSGRIHFSQQYNGGRFQAIGAWSEVAGGALQVQALDAAPAPCSPPGTYIMSGSMPFNVSKTGKLAYTCRFDATGTGQTYGAIFSGPPGGIGMHARQDSPPSSTGFTSFGIPLINSGWRVCAFANFTSPGAPPPGGTGGPRTGVFTGASGGLAASATSLSVISDYNGGVSFGDVHWTGFNTYCVNGANAVVFHANIDSPTSPNGVFVFDAQGIRTIALANTAVPGIGGASWGSFNPPVICDNGDVFFMANMTGAGLNSSNNVVLCRYRDHTTTILARSGQAVAGLQAGTTLSLSLTNISANALGQVALIAGTQPGFTEVLLATDRLGTPRVVYKAPDAVTVRGTLVRTFSSIGATYQSGGNDGRQCSINNAGEVAVVASCNVAPGQPFGQNGKCIAVFQSAVGPCGAADIGGQGGVLGADGMLNNNDFVVFIDLFFAANGIADVGVQGGVPGHDGLFDNNDFVVFIDLFFDGCGS